MRNIQENPSMRFDIRPATPDDAPVIAGYINMSGQGVPLYSWKKAAGRTGDPLQIGADRVRREVGNLSYRNVKVAQADGSVAGMVLAYSTPNAGHNDLNGVPDYLRPFVRLEGKAAQSYYINALAVAPEFRRKGIASRLLHMAEQDAIALGAQRATAIVFAENQAARALFKDRGYEEQHTAPIAEHESHPYERTKLILMVLELPVQE